MKINSIFKSITIFILILIIFSTVIIYLSSKMIEDTLDSNAKQRVEYTIDTLAPMVKTSLEFSLESFLTDNLNEIIETNKHILKIIIRDQDGSIIAQSENSIDLTNKNFVSKQISFSDTKKGFIEAYPSQIQKGDSFELYKDRLFELVLSVPFLIVIAVFLYSLIIVLHNKEKEKAYDELKMKMDEEIKNHQKKTNMLFHQSRLAQMGEMLSNIAHQWRQPLNTISLVIQNLKISFAMNNLNKDDFESSMEKIENSLQYMSKTITTFRDFYNTNTKQEVFMIKNVLDETSSIMGSSLNSSKIDLIIDTKIDDKVLGYKNELTQVIVNILANAKEIFEKRNTANALINIKTSKPTENILLISIEDNAGGIKEEIIDKIFDPYFTTKHKDQGTGLGLYMSQIIIKEKFNGKLKALNIKDGARFDIELNIYKDN